MQSHGPFTQILPLLTFCPIFFITQTHLRLSCTHHSPLPQMLLCVFPKNKAVLLHNPGAVINFSKFNIDAILLSNLPSEFQICLLTQCLL